MLSVLWLKFIAEEVDAKRFGGIDLKLNVHSLIVMVTGNTFHLLVYISSYFSVYIEDLYIV